MEKLYFTKYGYELFLNKIKEKEKVIKEMSSRLNYLAEVGGDQYHDNFSYEQQVRDLTMLTKELKNSISVLSVAIIIDTNNKTIKDINTVYIGSKITAEFGKNVESWEIVGYDESDPKNHKIAYNSRLGIAFMKKHTGDSFEYKIGLKTITVKIIKIQ